MSLPSAREPNLSHRPAKTFPATPMQDMLDEYACLSDSDERLLANITRASSPDTSGSDSAGRGLSLVKRPYVPAPQLNPRRRFPDSFRSVATRCSHAPASLYRHVQVGTGGG